MYKTSVFLTESSLKRALFCLKPLVIHQVRPHFGQRQVAERLRSLLHSSVYPSEIAGELKLVEKGNITHLMYGPEGNSYFCSPESPDVSLVKLVSRGTIHYVHCYILRLSLKQSCSKNKQTKTARGQQLRNRIPVAIHLNLIRGT